MTRTSVPLIGGMLCGVCYEKQATWRVGKCKHKLCKDCLFFIAAKQKKCPFCRGKVRSVNLKNFTKKQLIKVCQMMHWDDWKNCILTRSNLVNFCLLNQILEAAKEAGILFMIPRDPAHCCENLLCFDCWRARSALDPWPGVTNVNETDYIMLP